MRTITASLAIALLVPFSIFAAPVYLDCTTRPDLPKVGAMAEFKFSLKIDEATSDITHTDPDGDAFNTKGFFSANEISYQKRSVANFPRAGHSLSTDTAYRIDRTNLSIQRSYVSKLDGVETGAPSVSTGTCAIVDVKARKI